MGVDDPATGDAPRSQRRATAPPWQGRGDGGVGADNVRLLREAGIGAFTTMKEAADAVVAAGRKGAS